MQAKQLLHKGMMGNLHASLPTTHWPELGHRDTPSCKGGQAATGGGSDYSRKRGYWRTMSILYYTTHGDDDNH